MTQKKDLLKRLRYEAFAYHKRQPGDYGFVPSDKSLCDDIRPVLRNEAVKLLRRGICMGMVSSFQHGGVPKYVWAVDGDDEVYEAKTQPRHQTSYHGYRLGSEDPRREYVLQEWNRRCR